MAKCNATTLTLSGPLGMTPPLFAPNVDKTSRPRHTMPTANVRTEQQDIARIAKSAASLVAEKIGQGPFIQLSLKQMHKPAKFVMLTSRLKRFTQTVALLMVQKNTVADAKVAYLQGQNKNSQKPTHQKRRSVHQAQKISFPASLITPQNANSILGLISILFTFFNFMSNSEDAVLCLELR